MSELLLGCGHRRDKLLVPEGRPAEWTDLTTVDINPRCGADFVMDLDVMHDWPLPTGAFHEVHAYEVLEHLGRQGDAAAFFHHFAQIYRILKPHGLLCATVPSRYGPWVWGDPGHTRVILRETLAFLDRATYHQLGQTAISDYRAFWPGDFQCVYHRDVRATFEFVLRAVKPPRPYDPAELATWIEETP